MNKFSGKYVDSHAIKITDGFWFEKQKMVEEVTIQAVYERFKETGRFDDFSYNWKEGMPFKPDIFWESDIAKWIEGCSYFLEHKRNLYYEDIIDTVAELMHQNQDSSGYFNAHFSVVEKDKRFMKCTEHELYCAGHLIEAAIAYHKATGKDRLLKNVIQYVSLIDRVFRIEHSASFDTPGHEEIELALMKLFHYTGENRYKELAEYFINMRGRSNRDKTYAGFNLEYMQSHAPVREQTQAVGHAVRALYLYSAMADLAQDNKEEKLSQVCQILFENIVHKKMFITGGVGSTYKGESFTYDYHLPPDTAYCETCASIALAFFCKRMWLINENALYADTAEQALYNTMLSGISLSGDKFFYENPLSVDPLRYAYNESLPSELKEHLPLIERVKVFECSCCPPNVIRTIGNISSFMYSVSDHTIYAHVYMTAEATIAISTSSICLLQKTQYPYEGKICFTVKTLASFTLALRIPHWCDKYSIEINNEIGDYPGFHGYVFIQRKWHIGDEVILNLDMAVKFIECNPQSKENAGRIAVTRGPLVYCAEGVDNPDCSLKDVKIITHSKPVLTMGDQEGFSFPFVLLQATKRETFSPLYRVYNGKEKTFTLKLIPYFAWANRGVSELNTWFLCRENESLSEK